MFIFFKFLFSLQETEQVLVSQCGRLLGDTKDVCTNPIIKGFQKVGCQFHRLAEVSECKPTPEEFEIMKQDFSGFSFAESEASCKISIFTFLSISKIKIHEETAGWTVGKL